MCTGEGCLRTGSIIQELRLVINRAGMRGFSIAYYWISIFSICFSPSPFSSHSQIVSLCSLGWLLILYTDKAGLKFSGILLHLPPSTLRWQVSATTARWVICLVCHFSEDHRTVPLVLGFRKKQNSSMNTYRRPCHTASITLCTITNLTAEGGTNKAGSRNIWLWESGLSAAVSTISFSN